MLIDASQILASVGSPMTTFKSLIVNNHGSNVIGSAQIDAAVPSLQAGAGRTPSVIARAQYETNWRL